MVASEKYDSIKMVELVSVRDTGDTLELIFTGNRRVRITVSDGNLISVVSAD